MPHGVHQPNLVQLVQLTESVQDEQLMQPVRAAELTEIHRHKVANYNLVDLDGQARPHAEQRCGHYGFIR